MTKKFLAYIAKKDEKYYFRKAAVEKLTDQVALADIAINDKDVIVREAAIEMLTDHAILADIAKNMDDYAGYSELVNIAISRLTDQNVLTEVAKNAKNYSGRQIAFKKLGLEDSQEALADRALSDEELSVCMAAVYKLTDQGMLTYMTKNSQYHEVRQIAFKKLGLDDSQEALLDRVDWNPRVSIRIAAVDKLVDQKVLIELAKCSDDGVNIAAVEKLTDQAILADIAKNAADHHVRQTAYKKLGLEESQEALADRTEIALILAKRAKPAAKKGIDLLQEVYTRNDLLYPTITEKIEKAKKELKIGGIEGSKALANLIIDMLESRCSAISSALNIAKELTPTPQLLKAIQSVLSSGPLKAGSSGRFTPEIIGGGKIGWTDGTYKGIKELANESLTLLSKKLIL